MGYVADMIVREGKISLGLAQQMLKEIKPEQFASKPRFGDRVVDTNHPAFVYGHLATYPARLLGMLGAGADGADGAAAPASYAELFSAGKECKDDPAGEIYPPMDEIVGNFTKGYEALLGVLAGVSDEKFQAPNPMEGRMKEMLPTLGELAHFMVTSHIMMHMGQVSAWRRCFGLGRVM